MSDQLDATAEYDAYAHYARLLIEKQIPPPFLPPPPPPELQSQQLPVCYDTKLPIGIIGAGVGGLYAAMMLESLDIPFQILEASGRTGGRLFTYEFSTDDSKQDSTDKQRKKSEYNYYDVGAMRYPNTNIMRRLFHLFYCKQLNSDGIDLKSHIIPYLFEDKKGNSFLLYNNIRVRRKDFHAQSGDVFGFGVHQGGDVGEDFVRVGYGSLVKEAFQGFADALEEDLKHYPPEEFGWRKLMRFDQFSTRGYMSNCMQLPATAINWVETMDSSTGMYNQAFSEDVLDYVAFGGESKVEWKCLDGGSHVLSDAMTAYILKKFPPKTTKDLGMLVENAAVTDIEPEITLLSDKIEIKLQVTDAKKCTRSFQHVISTIPLTCLRTLNLDKCRLTFGQSNALRQLSYGPAVKIGIKFKSAWWSTWSTISGEPIDIVGGQSFTDRNVRRVVYPSYGIEGDDRTTVLIASYAWTEDALRLGGLIGAGSEADKRLIRLVLRDLATIHNVELKKLEDEYEKHFPYSWTDDPLSQGAYAHFGPSTFSNLYTQLTQPAAFGMLHFAGEALSVRHAWVVGALDSSWRAVREILWQTPEYRSKIPKFEKLWGTNMEWVTPPTTKDGKPEDLLLKYIGTRQPEIFGDLDLDKFPELEWLRDKIRDKKIPPTKDMKLPPDGKLKGTPTSAT